MTNVKGPEKKLIRRKLVRAAIDTLEKEGWKVTRVRGGGKGRLRRIAKDATVRLAAIRTSQDTWIAFPRNDDDTAWVTLSEVDVVVAVSVDDPERPQHAQVHFLEADELREHFDRAYAARTAAGHTITKGRGVWVSLYHEEGTSPVQRVGAGIGNTHPPIARIPLGGDGDHVPPIASSGASGADDDLPLTIADAKRRLARTLGVRPDNIRITVEA
ncbi:MAG: hypothetical protein WD690_08410 [Vicinamibacterales bacterium]